MEVYVRAFDPSKPEKPGPGPAVQVSTNGTAGMIARRQDGKELILAAVGRVGFGPRGALGGEQLAVADGGGGVVGNGSDTVFFRDGATVASAAALLATIFSAGGSGSGVLSRVTVRDADGGTAAGASPSCRSRSRSACSSALKNSLMIPTKL
jgi:hypothetical protein